MKCLECPLKPALDMCDWDIPKTTEVKCKKTARNERSIHKTSWNC